MEQPRAHGITQVYFVSDLGSTPATINRRTGELYINRRLWQQMPPPQRLFVLLHEMGHVALQTTDEHQADRWAFEQYAGRGHSLQHSVYALTRQLSGRSPEHYERMHRQLQRAREYDRQHNRKRKNKKDMAYSASNSNFDVEVRQYDNTLDFPVWHNAAEQWGDIWSYSGQADLQAKKAIIKKMMKQRQQAQQRKKAEARRRALAKKKAIHRKNKLNARQRQLQADGRQLYLAATPPPAIMGSTPRPRIAAPSWENNPAYSAPRPLGRPKGLFSGAGASAETW